MNEQELIKLARQQGATHYSRLFKEFYRRDSDGQIEVAKAGEDGTLGEWLASWMVYVPESAVRI